MCIYKNVYAQGLTTNDPVYEVSISFLPYPTEQKPISEFIQWEGHLPPSIIRNSTNKSIHTAFLLGENGLLFS